MAMKELREQVTCLEDFVGASQGDDAMSLSIANEQVTQQILMMKIAVTNLRKDMKNRLVSVMEDLTTLTDAMKENFKNFEDEMVLLKRTIVAPSGQIEGATSKIKILEPKLFNGVETQKS